MKKVSYPTNVQSKSDVSTDIYLEEGIYFSDQLNTGIDLAINFELV